MRVEGLNGFGSLGVEGLGPRVQGFGGLGGLGGLGFRGEFGGLWFQGRGFFWFGVLASFCLKIFMADGVLAFLAGCLCIRALA